MSVGRKILSLNGEWEYAYCMKEPDRSEADFPAPECYEVRMPVPGNLHIDFSTDEGYDVGGHVQKEELKE